MAFQAVGFSADQCACHAARIVNIGAAARERAHHQSFGLEESQRRHGVQYPQPSFRDGAISAFTRVFDALWRRTRNPEKILSESAAGFRVRAFGAPPE